MCHSSRAWQCNTLFKRFSHQGFVKAIAKIKQNVFLRTATKTYAITGIFHFFDNRKGSIHSSDLSEPLKLIGEASLTLTGKTSLSTKANSKGINILLEEEDSKDEAVAIQRMTPSEPKMNPKQFESWILSYPIILDFFEYFATKYKSNSSSHHLTNSRLYDPQVRIPPSIELLLEENSLKPVDDDFLVGSSELLSQEKISQVKLEIQFF